MSLARRTKSEQPGRAGPPQLAARLFTFAPFARWGVVGSAVLGTLSVATLVVQAVALASVFTGGATHVAILVAASALVARVVLGLLGDPLTNAIAWTVASRVRRSLADVGPRTTSAEEFVDLGTRGTESLALYLATYVPALVVAVASPIIVLTWMAWTDTLSAIIVAATLVALPLAMVLQGLAARDSMRRRWQDQQRLARYFDDVVRGMSTLKAFARDQRALEGLADAQATWTRSTMATLRVAFVSSFSLELLASLATALVALVLGIRLLSGRVSLAVALAILILTPEAYLPLRRASARYHAGQEGLAAASELLEVVATPRATGRDVGAPTHLALHEVAVGHGSNGARDLGPFSFEVPPHTLVALVGPSGSGKSTLLATIAGRVPPRAGRVLVNGHDQADLDLSALAARIGWMSQQPVLTGDTIADAVRAGRDVTPRAVELALARAELTLDLRTPLGDGASALSAGQRRRVALARALVNDPSLLLLDEPLAHLDDATAEALARTLRHTGVTTIVATHRRIEADLLVEMPTVQRV